MEHQGKERYHEEVYSQQIRAGKRTYFFDIKATRNKDFFICITESKRKPNEETGGFSYEKHKIFLYKEDFDKFFIALSAAIKRARAELMVEGARDISDLSEYVNEDGLHADEAQSSSKNV